MLNAEQSVVTILAYQKTYLHMQNNRGDLAAIIFKKNKQHYSCVDFITTPFHKNIDREFQHTNSLNELITEH